MPTTDPAVEPHALPTLTSALGDTIETTRTGALRRLDIAGLSMLLYPASELEAGLGMLYLRTGNGAHREVAPLLGPDAGWQARVEDGAIVVDGSALGLDYRVQLALSASDHAWFWQVTLRNPGAADVPFDLVLAHDVALAPYGNVRINEYYVSQYLDLTPVEVPGHGTALAVRQNMPGEKVPWVVLACLGEGEGWATDAFQLARRIDGRMRIDLRRDLPSARLQHEHTLAVLASAAAVVRAGSTVSQGFVGRVVGDHPAATGPADAAEVSTALALPEASRSAGTPAPGTPIAGSLFAAAPLIPDETADLHRLFPGEWKLEEHGRDRRVLSFVAADEHVATAAKERLVLRPHGHILRTGCALTPETGVLTSTIWMTGGFAGQVTQGHVSRNKLVSGRRTYLGLQRAHGLRIFADTGDGRWQLLDLPTAWALRPDRARWIYTAGDLVLEVTATAPTARHELRLDLSAVHGRLARVLVAFQVALGEDDGQGPADLVVAPTASSVRVAAAEKSFTLDWNGGTWQVGDDGAMFADGVGRGLPWVTLLATDPQQTTFVLTADTVPAEEQVQSTLQLADVWDRVRNSLSVSAPDSPLAGEVLALDETLPWFTHNAFVHYLSPRGLEQYTGGGWGTRDVSQGPVGLLTAIGRFDAQREVLLAILRAHNDRGDWAQAFDFLPPRAAWGQWESHGDVVYWPLLAIGEYLQASADASLLTEEVQPVGDTGPGDPIPVEEHLRRAVGYIQAHTVPGSPLPAYGHGDWNDSLQPADPRLAKQMASTWTATLQTHALRQLAAGLSAVGAASDLADTCRGIADATVAAMLDDLYDDELLSGYGVFGPDGLELLVHPEDSRTGLTYGVLPWIHAISGGQLSRDQAEHHLGMLRDYLWGPDGARLFNRPAAYRGGPMHVFQRAEAATFWGREIGLMYTHAHLRYAEALAAFGDAKGLFEALLLASPIGVTGRIPSARPRQATCYYSSSDAVFADRYEADERYGGVRSGEVQLEGGWRIYSSGPGLFLRLVVENLLGVRVRGARVELDPVLDPRLDGLTAKVPYRNSVLNLQFRVAGSGSGVTSVSVDGAELQLQPLSNPYRAPGVSVPADDLQRAADAGRTVVVAVGA